MTDQIALEDQIVATMRRFARALDSRSRTLLHERGLTAPQLATLQAVSRLGTAMAGSIAKDVQLGQPTLTGILDRLEKRGLVRRIRGQQDRRSVYVEITAAGRQILENPPSLLQDPFRQRLGELHAWEQTLILSTLQRLCDMLDAPQLEPSSDPVALAPSPATASPPLDPPTPPSAGEPYSADEPAAAAMKEETAIRPPSRLP